MSDTSSSENAEKHKSPEPSSERGGWLSWLDDPTIWWCIPIAFFGLAGSNMGEGLWGQKGYFLGLGVGGAIGSVIGFCVIGLVVCPLCKRVFPYGVAVAFGAGFAALVGGAGGALGVHLIGGEVGGWVGCAIACAVIFLLVFWTARNERKET